MPHGQVTLDWGDGEHVFNIARIGQLLELEEKCAAGVMTVFSRLRNGTFFVNDFRETLRLGLIGGGMDPRRAMILIRRYVDDRPLIESVMPAMAVLSAALLPPPGEEAQPGKPPADQTASEPAVPMTGLSDPPSTAAAQHLD